MTWSLSIKYGRGFWVPAPNGRTRTRWWVVKPVDYRGETGWDLTIKRLAIRLTVKREARR